ncbi:MAG: hypothetical protein ACI8UZ_000879, partial [Akkermansiaceae bacterium]
GNLSSKYFGSVATEPSQSSHSVYLIAYGLRLVIFPEANVTLDSMFGHPFVRAQEASDLPNAA